MPDIDRVFLSATKTDLTQHRLSVRDAILDAGCFPVTMENFAAEDSAPLDVCLREVESCQALIVLSAHRYGWIPPGQPDPGGKSITWLECEHAQKHGIPIFALLVDPAHPWPEEMREEYRTILALRQLRFTPELGLEVQDAIRRLGEFKSWLGNGRIIDQFADPASAAKAVLKALNKWRPRDKPATPQSDPKAAEAYLDALRESTQWIDLRGLKVGSNRATRVEIEKIYVGIKTSGGERSIPLEKALHHRLLVIQGDPGSGKTTFLRRIARELCRKEGPSMDLPVRGFPIFLRTSEIDRHIALADGERGAPSQPDSPQWIAHFLATGGWGLSTAFVEQKLATPGTVVLLDGLDEAASGARRRILARLLEKATARYKDCRFVVTTRPQAYQGEAVLAGFETVKIEEFDDEAVAQFLHLWAGCLFSNPDQAGAHMSELRRALGTKPEIRRMARNPVMLTALAVVQWNEARLPEQRAELYESVLVWLARSREMRPGRASAETCLDRLGDVALGMQRNQKGRLRQIERGAAAKLIKGMDPKEALSFLAEEEVDSGILVSRKEVLEFWHLTFQEFLAARELAGMKDEDQYTEVLRDRRLYHPEWREVMLLLAGILKVKQGSGKVDGLFEKITAEVKDGAFEDQARCVALLNGMIEDLRPTGYQPSCARYQEFLGRMKRLFEPGGAAGLDLKTRVAAAEALGQEGHPGLWLPSQEQYWVPIPGGPFTMGAQKKDPRKPNYDRHARNDEPVREVNVTPFRMGRYPVTVWEYGKFVEAGGAEPGGWLEQQLHPSRPVVYVSWHDAVAYCKWAGCRLPTEEEWEFAARGKDGRKYPWGIKAVDDRRANFGGHVGAPTPAGMFPDGRSPYGCDDMSGNVWEWTSGKYGSSSSTMTVRGGAWILNAVYARCAYRNYYIPDARIYGLGFRCAGT